MQGEGDVFYIELCLQLGRLLNDRIDAFWVFLVFVCFDAASNVPSRTTTMANKSLCVICYSSSPLPLPRSPTRGPGCTSCWPGSTPSSRSGSATLRSAGPRNTSSTSRTCAWAVTPSTRGWTVSRRYGLEYAVFCVVEVLGICVMRVNVLSSPDDVIMVTIH